MFYSESLYCKYVLKKYRDYAIPSIKERPTFEIKKLCYWINNWENGKKQNWLVINIPANFFEYNVLSNEGDTIIKYNGIPENAFSGCFFLYVFVIDYINNRFQKLWKKD